MGSQIIIGLIRLYQLTISPDHGVLRYFRRTAGACKFYPSCSEYARQAVAARGVRRGLFLGIRRILKCHPWATSGIDEIPKTT